jgi:type I restriction enzyme M protein
MAKKINQEKEQPLEKKLWAAADKLRKNMDAAEYKHVVLGLIFLKYISDAFEEQYEKLLRQKNEGADPEDKNEYIAEKVFYVPPSARWKWLQGRAKLPTIGKDIDDAMEAIERDNPKSLRGVVKLLVEMLEPYEGRVFDPCCGSGGMFVQSEKFIEHHRDHYKKNASPSAGKKLSLNPADHISIYGQESNQTTWRLCKMNLAIRGIDSSNIKWNNEGSFLNHLHKDLKADYIMANPPFNDSDWSGEGNCKRNC